MDAGRAKVLMLQGKKSTGTQRNREEATDNESKGRLFFETFFPPPNPNAPAIPEPYQYPRLKEKFKNIMDEQIH